MPLRMKPLIPYPKTVVFGLSSIKHAAQYPQKSASLWHAINGIKAGLEWGNSTNVDAAAISPFLHDVVSTASITSFVILPKIGLSEQLLYFATSRPGSLISFE